MSKYFRHLNPIYKAFLAFIILGVLAVIVPVYKSPVDVAAVLGATSIFYSILLGFYIASAMTNLSRLKTLAASETGALIAVYHIIELSLEDKLKSTAEAIDAYLIKRFQFEVNDYTEPTTKDFFAIFNCLKGAKAKSDGDGAAIDYVAGAMYYVAQARREITVVGAKIMNSASWALMILLSFIIVVSLFLMRDGSLIGNIVTIFLSTAAIFSLFILNDIDGNQFGEEQFAINIYQDVFSAIGRLHYYPEHYLQGGRYKPKVKQYRVGTPGNLKVVQK